MEFKFKGSPGPLQGWTRMEEVGELGLEILTGPQRGAQGGEVGVHDLAIHGTKPFEAQPPHEVHKGHFRRVGRCREHAFAEEHAAERHAVKSSHQVVPVPSFHRVGQPEVVEFDVGLDNVVRDPRAFTVARRMLTSANHLFKGPVQGDAVTLPVEFVAHAFGHFELQHRQNGTFRGRPPQDGVFFHEPGEGSVLIGGEQPGTREITSDRQQSMLSCDIHRGKIQIGIEHLDLHGTK